MTRMLIETETTPNPATLKFLPGRAVMPSGTRDFATPEEADASPLAEALFGLVGRAAADLGQSFSRKDTGGVCDGNNIAACRVPVIDTMGACGGEIHSPREFLLVDSLVTRARLSALVLHRINDEGIPA